MKTYTAREWLEKTLPNDVGHWHHQTIAGFIMYHYAFELTGIRYKMNGEVDSPASEIGKLDQPLVRISRSTAIDLMVSAIEGGEVGEKASTDPYAHLPHGGWWVHHQDRLVYWPDMLEFGQMFDLNGHPCEPIDRCNDWNRSSLTYLKQLTRDQAIAIIEAHKASKEPTPAPSFGGPHDEQAVKWAEERGHRVVAYRPTKTGDRFIPFSYAKSKEPWGDAVSFSKDDAGDAVYILAPLTQPEPEQKKGDGYHDVDEFYREDEDEARPIDPQLFELVKAMVTGLSSSCTQTDRDYIIHNAKQLLAELRKEGE